jgi:hypothetical protein
MSSLSRLITRAIRKERAAPTTAAAATAAAAAAAAVSPPTPYGGEFDIGALAFSLHQFLESHSAELRAATVALGGAPTASQPASPSAAPDTGSGAPHDGSPPPLAREDSAVAAAGLPPTPYGVLLPVHSCLELLRDLARHRGPDVWAVVDSMTVSEEVSEALLAGGAEATAAAASLTSLGQQAAAAGMPVTSDSALRSLLVRYMTLERGVEGLPTTAREAAGDDWSVAEAAVREYADTARWIVACFARSRASTTHSREKALCDEFAASGLAGMAELEEAGEGSADRFELVLDAVEAGAGSAGAELVDRLAAARAQRLKAAAAATAGGGGAGSGSGVRSPAASGRSSPTLPAGSTGFSTVSPSATRRRSDAATAEAATPVGMRSVLAKIYGPAGGPSAKALAEKENSAPQGPEGPLVKVSDPVGAAPTRIARASGIVSTASASTGVSTGRAVAMQTSDRLDALRKRMQNIRAMKQQRQEAADKP